jgi:polyhydroxyalkanoate synthesis regulator phasin
MANVYEDLQPIIQLQFGKEVERISRETQAKVREAEAQYVASTRGAHIISGQHEAALGRIRTAGVEEIARSLFQMWVDIITERNSQVNRGDIDFIMQKVTEFTNAQAGNLGRVFAQRPSAVVPMLTEEARNRMAAVVGCARRDLEIMVRRNEALPKKPVEEKQTVVHLNIQKSNIANLNLGSQVGIINTALETISSGGGNQQEFANSIKELIEAIVSQKELKDDQKREAVQALSTVAEEAQKKPEERSTGTVKAIIAYIPTVISSISQLESLWEKVGPTIKGYLGL